MLLVASVCFHSRRGKKGTRIKKTLHPHQEESSEACTWYVQLVRLEMGKKSGIFLWGTSVLFVAVGFTAIISLATGIFLPQAKFETRLPSFCHPPKTSTCDCPSISENTLSKNPLICKNNVPKNHVSKNLSNPIVPKNGVSKKVEKAAKEATRVNAIIVVVLTFLFFLIVVPFLLEYLIFYGEKINHWCVFNNEARDQFKISSNSIQFALHYLGDQNPYFVIASCMWVKCNLGGQNPYFVIALCMWVMVTLSMCAAFTNRRLVRDVAAGSIPVSFAAMIDLFMKRSPCYAVFTGLVCTYSIALWVRLLLL